MSTSNFVIDEKTIEELYKQLSIEIDYTFSLEKTAQEYQEAIANIEQESLNTTAYINR